MGVVRALIALIVLFQLFVGISNTIQNPNNCNRPYIWCNTIYRYRSMDGTCNNLRRPRTGASGETLKRLLPNVYDDGKSIPRFRSVLGGDLPSARNVTAKTITSVTESNRTQYTNFFELYGQFIGHDIFLTLKVLKPNEERYVCCNESDPNIYNVDGGPCFPIQHPADDPINPNGCTQFVRSVGLFECSTGVRETSNFESSYLDGSVVYGSTKKDSDVIRLFHQGKLILGPNDLLPAADGIFGTCRPQRPDEYCFLAGDIRTNFHGGLTSIQTIYHRYHNLIADGLAQVNPAWNDERLFQEARRILGAVLQHITYNDYIPLLIGPAATRAYALGPQHYHRYYNTLYLSTFTEFVAAAYRFGHSMVPDKWTYGSTKIKVSDFMFSPFFVQTNEGLDTFISGLFTDSSQDADLKFSESIHEMFADIPGAHTDDLLALNVQRGREMGIPSYNSFRAACNLPKLTSFDDGSTQGEILGRVYSHVDDVDLYIGGISEPAVPGGVVGPTFACIIATQFLNVKYGDRFWYENPRPVYYDHSSGFTRGQLYAIRRLKLSRIICDTSNIDKVPENPLLHARHDNPERDCTDFQALPALNLNFWTERWYGRK